MWWFCQGCLNDFEGEVKLHIRSGRALCSGCVTEWEATHPEVTNG